jgi:hypothetical protein
MPNKHGRLPKYANDEERRETHMTAPIPIDAFISLEEVARRLHADIGWVREKIRRRCPNPMPVFNLGRHLVFDWTQVVEWVRKSPRPIHAAHPPRRRKKLAKAA